MRVTAQLTITGPAGLESRSQDVVPGTVLVLGADRYQVLDVMKEKSSRGAVTVRPI